VRQFSIRLYKLSVQVS